MPKGVLVQVQSGAPLNSQNLKFTSPNYGLISTRRTQKYDLVDSPCLSS